MTKEAARRLRKKCWGLAYQFVDGSKAERLTELIFRLIRKESKNGQMAGVRKAKEAIGLDGAR